MWDSMKCKEKKTNISVQPNHFVSLKLRFVSYAVNSKEKDIRECFKHFYEIEPAQLTPSFVSLSTSKVLVDLFGGNLVCKHRNDDQSSF